MKIKLKTAFWNEKEEGEWREKVSKQITLLELFALMNIVAFMTQGMWVMMIINITILIIAFMMQKSKHAWEKENGKKRTSK